MGKCAAVVRAAILAAGASARMGRPKAGLVLPDNGDTFVRRLVRTFGAAGFADIVVVTGAVDEPIRRAAGRLRGHVRFVHNRAWEAGQLTSLQAALDADSPGPPRRADLLEAIAVTLVDAPLVTPDTVRRVLAAWRLSRAPIVRPARGDVHGHPVIFDRAVFAELRAADPAVGAKSVVRAHADRVLNVPVDDAGAFLDIDTEDDYRRAIDQLSASDRLSRSV
jgi:CTP:molybdopterin cytidylyltransferase MocA